MQGAQQRRLIPRLLAAGLAFLLLGLLAAPAGAAKHAPGPRPDARAWVVIDARDGAVLVAHDPRRRLAIASTTKLMTAHLARERLPLRREVTAPDYQPLPGESLMGLRPGERVTVRNLLYGLLLPSGNDAAVALAKAVSGSVAEFVAAMNREAGRLGLRDTHYANPIGLDAPANYSTARDLAALAIRLRHDRVLRGIFDTEQRDVPGAHPEHVVNHNDLLAEVPWVNGVKTGFTLDARYVLVGSATRDGVTLVSVLLGAPTIAERDAGSLELLRYGFSLYDRHRTIRRGEHLRSIGVSGRALPLVAGETVRAAARQGQRIRAQVELRPGLEGPIERGERLGRVVVLVGGRVAAEAPAVAGRAIPAPREDDGVIERLDDAIPGPRVVLVAGAALIAAAIVIGIGAPFARRRRAGW